MGLSVVFVSGPRRSGKSSLIRTMIDRVCERKPHYIRLTESNSDKKRPKPSRASTPDCHVASARWLEYDPQKIYEVLPEALAAIHRGDRFGSVIIEADVDPTLRTAYPYDHRVFVMAIPSAIDEVFRSQESAAVEFKRVLDDTSAFANEVFGLCDAAGEEDVEPSEERSDFTKNQLKNFLHTPLGDELVNRIQLTAPYHGLVESDIVVINNAAGNPTPESRECLTRIEKLLQRKSSSTSHPSDLFHCDPTHVEGHNCRKLLETLRPMCAGGH